MVVFACPAILYNFFFLVHKTEKKRFPCAIKVLLRLPFLSAKRPKLVSICIANQNECVHMKPQIRIKCIHGRSMVIDGVLKIHWPHPDQWGQQSLNDLELDRGQDF